jgi:dCTP deaminase
MEIENYVGTLNDIQIAHYCANGLLISTNYNQTNLQQACYELTASQIYYDISQGFNRIDINENDFGYILVKPKQSIVIITKEELNIPLNVIGRVLTKGKLFSVGLSPVNTYADPGFKGNLGIILQNNSINYLKIKEGELIAKIEFSVLQEPVSSAYSGQHGYKTKIWPIPVEFTLSQQEVENDVRIGNVENEIEQIYGTQYSKVINRLLGVEKRLVIAMIFYMTFSFLLVLLLILMDKKDWFSPFWAIITGLASNIISFIVMARLGKAKWLS